MSSIGHSPDTNCTSTLPAFAASTIRSSRWLDLITSGESVCWVAASVRKALTSENCIGRRGERYWMVSLMKWARLNCGRTSKRPIQGEFELELVDAVSVGSAVVMGDKLALALVPKDEGLESTTTRHSMPSDNSVYQTNRQHHKSMAHTRTYIASFFNACISIHSYHFRFHDIYSRKPPPAIRKSSQ